MADPYERLLRVTGLEGDEGNATKNWAKHTVGQAACEQVFFNAPLVLASDPAHSAREPRFFALGKTDAGRPLLVVFTLRDSLIRVMFLAERLAAERERKRRAGRAGGRAADA